MQNSQITNGDLSQLSKDELLDAMKELQRENQCLRKSIEAAATNCGQKKISFREQYAEKILDALPDMLTVVSDNGMTVAVVSSEETNHTGICRDDIFGVPVKDFLPEHVYDHVMLSIDQAIEHGKSENLSHLMYVDNKPHYYENRTVRIDHDNNLCICRDITEEMLAKIQLESLSYAVNLVNENIFSLNPEGEILFANKQFLKDHNLSSIAGKSALGVMFSFQTMAQWEELKQRIHENGGILNYIHENMDLENGENSYELVVHSVRSINNDEEFWFFARNITQRLKQDKELVAAKLQAEESNRLKSAFLANMSHEIRTPLNAIVGFAKLIMTEEDQISRKEYSDIIDSNAELLLQLINDILDISKIEAGTLDFSINQINLDELCNEMLEIHRMRAPEGISITYETSDKDLIIDTDRNRLAQVFTNLLSNAIKFTQVGEIRFGYTVKGDRIEAFVSDSGMGISAEKLPSIFNRFVKLNNFVAGTGLGLSITKTIIERLGGSISATSIVGKGSEFRFTIPYSEHKAVLETENDQSKASAMSAMGSAPNKSILIAEDNDSNYLLLTKFLGDKYPHHRAENGKIAVEMFKQHSPTLILMDMKMPLMNGLEATKAIRELSKTVPIVALTAFAYESDKVNALAAGCNEYLTKPISLRDLSSVIEQYMDQAQ